MTIFGKSSDSSKWTSKGSSDTSTDLTLGGEHNPRTDALVSDDDLLWLFFDGQDGGDTEVDKPGGNAAQSGAASLGVSRTYCVGARRCVAEGR